MAHSLRLCGGSDVVRSLQKTSHDTQGEWRKDQADLEVQSGAIWRSGGGVETPGRE